MVRTAEAALQSLPAPERAAVAVLKQTIRQTPYQRMDADQTRAARLQYRASVANDNQAPVDRQVSLELLQRRVPPERWAEIAGRAAATSPVIEASVVQELVMKMQSTDVPKTRQVAAETAAQASSELDRINAAVGASFRRDWDAGRFPATDADLVARGMKLIMPRNMPARDQESGR